MFALKMGRRDAVGEGIRLTVASTFHTHAHTHCEVDLCWNRCMCWNYVILDKTVSIRMGYGAHLLSPHKQKHVTEVSQLAHCCPLKRFSDVFSWLWLWKPSLRVDEMQYGDFTPLKGEICVVWWISNSRLEYSALWFSFRWLVSINVLYAI